MMVAELKKPFVWPEPAKEEDREAFDYKAFQKVKKAREENEKMQKLKQKGEIEERKAVPTEEHRKLLKKQAEEFLANPLAWDVGGMRKAKGESIWREVETEERFEGEEFEALEGTEGKDGEEKR